MNFFKELQVRALFLPLLLLVCSAEAATLPQVIKPLLDNQPQILEQKYAVIAADAQKTQAYLGFLPSLDVEASIGPEASNNSATRPINGDNDVQLTRKESSIILSETVFNGFFRTALIAERKANYKSANARLALVKNAVALATAQAYLAVMNARQIIEIYQASVASYEKTTEFAKKRVAGGAAGKAEYSLALSRLQLAKSRLENAEQALTQAENQYRDLVGEFPQQHLTLPSPALRQIPPSWDTVLTIIKNNSPELTSAQEDTLAVKEKAKQVASAFYPNISLNGSITNDNELNGVRGKTYSANVLLTVKYNLFAGGRDYQQYKTAKANYRRAEYSLENLSRNIYDAAFTTWKSLKRSANSVTYLESYRDNAQQVWLNYQKEYLANARSLFDLLSAENEYYSAKIAYINERNQWILNTYRLLSEMGELDTYFSKAT
jgi:adhesin transport system outer membrane protein